MSSKASASSTHRPINSDDTIRASSVDMSEIAGRIKVIAFDVFGTVVDWHGSVAREVAAMNLDVDPGKFALAWRAGYKPAMREVMDRGE